MEDHLDEGEREIAKKEVDKVKNSRGSRPGRKPAPGGGGGGGAGGSGGGSSSSSSRVNNHSKVILLPSMPRACCRRLRVVGSSSITFVMSGGRSATQASRSHAQQVLPIVSQE